MVSADPSRRVVGDARTRMPHDPRSRLFLNSTALANTVLPASRLFPRQPGCLKTAWLPQGSPHVPCEAIVCAERDGCLNKRCSCLFGIGLRLADRSEKSSAIHTVHFAGHKVGAFQQVERGVVHIVCRTDAFQRRALPNPFPLF